MSNYEADVELGKAQAKINALKTRAEKAELDLYRAIPVYEEALKLARERAEKAEAELAVRREQMHSLPICGGCMGKHRERLKALEQEWRELPKHYMLRAHLTADQVAAILAESEPGCEVCAERRRVEEESAQFLKDVEEGKRLLAESESDKTYVGTMSAQGDRWVEHATRTDPKSLPLGHEFIQSIDILGKSTTGGCCFSIVCLECGQPRSAHESKGIA